MNADNQPKVFISYSWAIREWVGELAKRLMNDGVETKVDLWDLKEGQDKYAFMESMVNDNTIDYVLVVCDKTYTEKANKREGGVGDETVIISSELYGKSAQTKFLPLVLSKDEDGKALVPIYIKSRIYFDFSDENNYENEYEKLLRHIYDKPLMPTPKLGCMPEFLNDNAFNLSLLSKHISVLKSSNNETRKNAAITEFCQDFAIKAKEFTVDSSKGVGNEIVANIEAMKPLRDLYLDFLKEVILSERDIADFVCRFFENVYNELMLLPTGVNSWSDSSYEHYKFLLWEMFVCTIAYLWYYEKYREIYLVLTHTYFLQSQVSPVKVIRPSFIMNFVCDVRTLESYGAGHHLNSFAASLAVKHVKEPLITQESFAQADIFISQMSFALKINDGFGYWFPLSYVYAKNASSFWIKLASRHFCEKILPLFNAKSIEDLKRIIQENPVSSDYRYSGAWHGSVPRIPLKIDNYGIAELS